MQAARNQIAAMAAECCAVLKQSNDDEPKLPRPLHSTHLLWMCGQIQTQAKNWPVSRLHRWIGFVQAGILTNRILDLDAIKAMFDEVKRSTAAIAEDVDLIDHLDVEHTFSLDIGGQG
jgi:hypothetical protein